MKDKEKILRIATLFFLLIAIPVIFFANQDKQQQENDWKRDLETVEKKRNDRLTEKRLRGNLTDSEKHEWVVEILDKIKVSEGPDQLYSGTVSPTEREGWVKYENATSGISVSFPRDTWNVNEWPDGDEPANVARVSLTPGTYIRYIRVFLTDNPAATIPDFKRGYWDEAVRQHGGASPTKIDNQDALIFSDVETGDVDGGVPVFGRMILIPTTNIFIATSEHESEPHPYDTGPEIFTEIIETIELDDAS